MKLVGERMSTYKPAVIFCKHGHLHRGEDSVRACEVAGRLCAARRLRVIELVDQLITSADRQSRKAGQTYESVVRWQHAGFTRNGGACRTTRMTQENTMIKQQPEIKVYAVGTERNRSVLFLLVDGRKFVAPTDLLTMSRLAELGAPIKNEA